ncbi:MAG TPA: replication-relaxation family protein [Thermoanaerobaculia bacterium]
MESGRHDPQESATSDALRPNDPAVTTAPGGARAAAGLVGTTGRTGSGVALRDPRHAAELSARDLAALRFIGMWICAQYQLALHVFPSVSETVVSRCVQRLLRLGLIAVERWNRIGLNMLRLRTAGLRLLVERGVATERELFVRRSAVATKDLRHHLWIVDLGLAFASLPVGFTVLPCWALRRKFAGQKVPIPDLLAVAKDKSRTLAIEVDLGSERTKWLAEKLVILAETVDSLRGDGTGGIIVLTVGEKRIVSLSSQIAETAVPVVVRALPSVVGRPAVAAIRTILCD